MNRIINFSNRLLFNFKNNYSRSVYNTILMSVKVLLIAFDIEKEFAINDYISIDMLDIKYIREV